MWSPCRLDTSSPSIAGTPATQVVTRLVSRPVSLPQGRGVPSQLTRPQAPPPRQPRGRWSDQEVFFVCFSLVAPHQGKRKRTEVKLDKITLFTRKMSLLARFLHCVQLTVYFMKHSMSADVIDILPLNVKQNFLKEWRLFWSLFYFIKKLWKVVFHQNAITLGHQFTGHCISWQHLFSGINRIF